MNFKNEADSRKRRQRREGGKSGWQRQKGESAQARRKPGGRSRSACVGSERKTDRLGPDGLMELERDY